MKTKSPYLGAGLALTAATLFGLNASTMKIIMQSGFTPEQLVLFRSIFTATLAGLIMLITNRKSFRVKKSEWKLLITFGIVGVALMQWTYSYAVGILPVGIALLFQYSAIIMVPIASFLIFKKKPLSSVWVGIAVVVSGLLVVSQIWTGGLNALGVAYGLASAVFMTFYFILGEHSHTNRDPISTLFYTMLISTTFWLVASPWWQFNPAALSKTVDLGGNLTGIGVPAFIAILWVGLMGSFMPMILSYTALGHLSATVVSVISTAETVFAFLFGFLWLNETISGIQMVGGLLVLTGIVWTQTARRK